MISEVAIFVHHQIFPEVHVLNKSITPLLMGLVLLLVSLTSCGREPIPTSAATTPTEEPETAAKPSNSGGPGPALSLVGDPQRGAQVFVNCVPCHGNQGKGGVANPGSTDGTVPPLNPIDSTIANKDPKVFAYNVDLFVEHGSTPEGPNPALKMVPWGDSKGLTPQQIADVIAYVMSLNQ
jgi:mono/diheme cytochrome c family protein